jgi:hypothetical protein
LRNPYWWDYGGIFSWLVENIKTYAGCIKQSDKLGLSAKEYFFPREGDLVCFPSWLLGTFFRILPALF